MTFAGRIRTYLILIALIPPLLVMSVIYFRSASQLEYVDRRAASDNLSQYRRFIDIYKKEFRSKVEELAGSGSINRAVLLIKSGRSAEIDISAASGGFDFLEILNDRLIVLASSHRPGLLGSKIHNKTSLKQFDTSGFMETTEYDISGRHAAIAYLLATEDNILLYAGRYIDSDLTGMLSSIMSADVRLVFESTGLPEQADFNLMDREELYETDGKMYSLLMGGRDAGYYLTAEFRSGAEKPIVSSLLKVTGVVTLVSVLIALLMGWYITGKAKKEIDNLIVATSRVAKGDFSTPVMAYEEGEFSQLADSISQMMTDLKRLQRELATSEKIAAWKTIGQKVAHEIKNPLTPITISIDDLRRSYLENLPDFDKTLKETTATIRSEIDRLVQLLDRFVSFARMDAPMITKIRPQVLIEDITALYQREIDSGRLSVTNNSNRGIFKLDPGAIKQVLLNLIKNSFETSTDTVVRLEICDVNSGIEIKVEDDGPGFNPEILQNRFQPYVSTKEDGSGLGLVICQRIVHDHGGSIDLYNRSEGGAGVIIKLPYNDG